MGYRTPGGDWCSQVYPANLIENRVLIQYLRMEVAEGAQWISGQYTAIFSRGMCSMVQTGKQSFGPPQFGKLENELSTAVALVFEVERI